MGSMFISSIETNLVYNPVPQNLIPGRMGENLPIGTKIIFNFLAEYNVNLTKIEILNNSSNIKSILVEYRDSNQALVLNLNNETITQNKNGSLLIQGNQVPSMPISVIILTIKELKDNLKNATLIVSIKGCFGKFD